MAKAASGGGSNLCIPVYIDCDVFSGGLNAPPVLHSNVVITAELTLSTDIQRTGVHLEGAVL